MAGPYWFVRAVTDQPGYDANEQPRTLTPGMRGRMTRAEAEAKARIGGVVMLSPGGVDALTSTPSEPEPRRPRPAKPTLRPTDPFAP